MSMREEDRQKNNCPSRGLGLAAAAIGVGVGAALYYFFSKRPENPDAEGSTSGWACEQPHAFNMFYDEEESDNDIEIEQNDNSNANLNESEYTTVSETTTTDTSVHDSDSGSEEAEEEESLTDLIPPSSPLSYDLNDFTEEDVSVVYESDWMPEDWDVTESSLNIPEDRQRNVSPLLFVINNIGDYLRDFAIPDGYSTAEQERLDMLREQALSEEEQIKFLKDQKFRERSWSLEECSICFEIMLKDQELTRLPCAHNFHANCIAPWLAEQQTCPNCRKNAE